LELLFALLVRSCQGAQNLLLWIVILAARDTQTGLSDEIGIDHSAVVTEEAEAFVLLHHRHLVRTSPIPLPDVTRLERPAFLERALA
jgi:hypothetical protein